jgi:hypothetical protein
MISTCRIITIQFTFETETFFFFKKSVLNCYKNDIAFVNTTKISILKKSLVKKVKQGALFWHEDQDISLMMCRENGIYK